MSVNKPTLGQAIDQMISALEPLDEAMRRTALTAVCMQLGLESSGLNGVEKQGAPADRKLESSGSVSPPTPHPTVESPQQHRIDIRTLKDQKKPSSARQMACIVAFYLQELAPEGERKDVVTTADLEKYFKQAGFRLPATISQVLKDAKSGGYFDAAGRGEYKLNAVGYNLVAHNLPSGND